MKRVVTFAAIGGPHQREKRMKRATPLLVLSLACSLVASTASAQPKLDRTVLPIAEPKPPTYRELDARNAKSPPPFQVKAPQGAPNVVIVLIDDSIRSSRWADHLRRSDPHADDEKLAASGLRFNNFHTTALCSLTRNALKTGRNHHTTNTGPIMESSTAFPGNTGHILNSIAPLAEVLRLNGYSTGAFGKWHETAPWETSVSGPFDRWPTHQCFDKFYGFIGGETDQWYPLVYDGVTKVDPPQTKDYPLHRRHDEPGHQLGEGPAVDDPGQAVLHPLLRDGGGARPAPRTEKGNGGGQVHGPVQGRLGPDLNVHTRPSEAVGVVPMSTELVTDWPTSWPGNSLPVENQRLFARQAEVYAGFMEHTDHSASGVVPCLGRLFVYPTRQKARSRSRRSRRVFYNQGDGESPACSRSGPEEPGLCRHRTQFFLVLLGEMGSTIGAQLCGRWSTGSRGWEYQRIWRRTSCCRKPPD